MGKSLAEYAAQNPQQEPEREREAMHQTAETVKDRQQERERAAQLMQSIQTQLEQGNAPQTILYTAITAIGLLAHDEAWAAAAQTSLDTVYADLAQQSLLVNEATIAAQRLEKMQEDYNEKLRRQLTRQLSGYQRIAKGLNEALDALNQLDPEIS
jgi:chemotaxis protein histidine kinase CheA